MRVVLRKILRFAALEAAGRNSAKLAGSSGLWGLSASTLRRAGNHLAAWSIHRAK